MKFSLIALMMNAFVKAVAVFYSCQIIVESGSEDERGSGCGRRAVDSYAPATTPELEGGDRRRRHVTFGGPSPDGKEGPATDESAAEHSESCLPPPAPSRGRHGDSLDDGTGYGIHSGQSDTAKGVSEVPSPYPFSPGIPGLVSPGTTPMVQSQPPVKTKAGL